MSGPLFSVIIPTYGRPRYLREAVTSVLEQSVCDLECIVVDDASPERVEIPSDPRVRVVRRERNGGPAAARNSGMDVATGRYVCFLDDDDLYTEQRLALAMETFDSAPVSICSRSGLGAHGYSARDLRGNVHDVILDESIPSLGQVAVVREAVPMFDESFDGAQDLEWWLRISGRHEVATVDEVGYLVRAHDGARHRNGTEARIRGSLRLMEMHAAYFRTHARARAFRWRRIGLMAMSLGDRHLAVRAFKASLRVGFTSRSAWHLTRALASRLRHGSEAFCVDSELRSEVLRHAS